MVRRRDPNSKTGAAGAHGSQLRTARENRLTESRCRERFHNTRIRGNAKTGPRQIRQYGVLDAPCQELLKASMNELGLSARAHDKVIRVARTIADLDSSADIQSAHLSEAINYRMLDRSFWT
jgi:magnesium chelatase family protein